MARRIPFSQSPAVEEEEDPNLSAAHPFMPTSWASTERGRKKGKRAQIVEEPSTDTTKQSAGFMSAGLQPENPNGLSAPNDYIRSALAKKPADRTLQEKEALKVRSRAEEITIKGGGKVIDGIMSDLITEERAPAIGRREAKAALGYYEASEKELAAGGRNPDGTKREPNTTSSTNGQDMAGAAAPQTAPARAGTSGGTMTRDGQTTTVPGTPAAGSIPDGARPAIGAVGFAMRTMPDGSVRTASGLNAGGSSNMQTFASKDAALAFYRPPAPAAAPQAAPTAIGQPAQPAPAPAAPATAAQPNPAQQAPAPQSPAAARTTSPTARLEMAGGTPGAPVSAPAASAPASMAAPAPQPFQTAVNGQTIAKPLPGGTGFDLMPGIELLRQQAAARPESMPAGTQPKNPFASSRPEFEMGTPKPRGFQESSADLEVKDPFSR